MLQLVFMSCFAVRESLQSSKVPLLLRPLQAEFHTLPSCLLQIIVTDDDVIEKSNLSRQFLFRDWNIGQ